MSSYVADTMAVILHLEQRKMPTLVQEKFLQAENDLGLIYLPSIVFAEIAYLHEKRRIETSLNRVRDYLNIQKAVQEYPLTLKSISQAFHIKDIPELHDRLIAAAARELDIPILTNDPAIHHSGYVASLWQKQYSS